MRRKTLFPILQILKLSLGGEESLAVSFLIAAFSGHCKPGHFKTTGMVLLIVSGLSLGLLEPLYFLRLWGLSLFDIARCQLPLVLLNL